MKSNESTNANLSVAEVRKNSWEEEKKRELIRLGQSSKPYNQILPYLQNEIEQSKKMASFNYSLLCFKDDGVYQLNRAIQEIYGVSSSKEDNSPSGDSTIETIDVQLVDGTRVKVPYGDISLPDLGEEAHISISYDTNKNELLVKGKTQFRYSSLIDDIVSRTKELLSTNSIYCGQALEMDNLSRPKILDLSNIDKEMMVLSEETEIELRPLRARIHNPEKCLEKGIPLKYGCLLEGPYGTGKTLLAFKLAKEALENGWVFIYLKDPKLLAQSLRLSKTIDRNGHGVIVFVEDIDQVTKGERDAALQDILNTLDGGDTKNMNVITLFTTNHIEKIEPTFLRGKRIGSIISMGFLDEKTADKFIRESFKGEGYKVEKDLKDACKMVAESEIAPAFMAEIVEALKSDLITLNQSEVKSDHLIVKIKSYLRQVQLSRKKDSTETPEMKLVKALREVLDVELLTKILREVE